MQYLHRHQFAHIQQIYGLQIMAFRGLNIGHKITDKGLPVCNAFSS